MIFDLGGLLVLPYFYIGLLVVSLVLVFVIGRMTRARELAAETRSS